MGTAVIKSQPGIVQVYKPKGSALPGVLSVTGPGGTFDSMRAVIITGMGVDQAVNVQFMPSLEKLIYVYSFGDRMGAITLHGLAFDRLCRKSSHAYQGMRELLEYYDESRAITEDRIIKVLIGGKYRFQGFLVSMATNTQSAEMRLNSFTMKIATLPRQTEA